MVQVTVYFRGWKAALICLGNLDGAVAGTKVEVTLLGTVNFLLAGQAANSDCLGASKPVGKCWRRQNWNAEKVQVRSHQCIASIARRQCHLVVISAHSTTLKFPRALKFTFQAVAAWCRHLQGVNCNCDTKATSPGPQVKWACIPRWRNSTMVRCKRQRNIKNHDMIVLW